MIRRILQDKLFQGLKSMSGVVLFGPIQVGKGFFRFRQMILAWAAKYPGSLFGFFIEIQASGPCFHFR